MGAGTQGHLCGTTYKNRRAKTESRFVVVFEMCTVSCHRYTLFVYVMLQVVLIAEKDKVIASKILKAMKSLNPVTPQQLHGLGQTSAIFGTGFNRGEILHGNHTIAGMILAALQFLENKKDAIPADKKVWEVFPRTWELLTTVSTTVYFGLSSAQACVVRLCAWPNVGRVPVFMNKKYMGCTCVPCIFYSSDCARGQRAERLATLNGAVGQICI
jgi:hypothetical protein